MREGSCKLDVDLDGRVAFASDERTISRIAPGGRLRILERRAGHERELVAKPGPDGAPYATFELDGRAHPYDDAAKQWFARILPELFRQTGMDAEGRVGRILARGGFDAVLTEARLIRSDSVQRLYLTELMEQSHPGREQVARVIDLAGRDISSDYDLAELLVGALGSQDVGAVVGSSGFRQACAAIDSDYDLRRVLVEAVQKAREPGAAELALACAKGIGSDYDRAELLTALTARWPRGHALSDQFYSLARDVSSDYDRRRTLQAAAERRPLPEADVRQLLASADAFHSDYDLAELLVSVAGAARIDGDLATAFERAAAHIGSSYDRQRAMAAIDRGDG